jgi:hypothetical protein
MDLIRLIFACFGIFANIIYLHHSLHTRFGIFAQIRIPIFDFMQKIHVAANIRFRANICLRFFSSWRIFASKYSFRSEYSQQFKRISHSGEYLLAKYSHTSEYSLVNIRIPAIFAPYCFELFNYAFHKSLSSINIRFFLKIFT